MKLLVLNGPNINMIGIREKEIYGTISYSEIIEMIHNEAKKREIDVVCEQSNHEGVLVDWIQQAYFDGVDGIIINPAAYTHTSVAILDALKAISPIPAVEVHLSDIQSRDEFRKLSYPAMACVKQISGYGPEGYLIAMDFLKDYIKSRNLSGQMS